MRCITVVTLAAMMLVLGLRPTTNAQDLTPISCPVRLCKRPCPFGYAYDENNCQLCECYNPCASTLCLEGTVCKPSLVQCFRAPCIPPSVGICVPITKPGQCPRIRPDAFGICVEECSNDADCKDDLKCCSNGCGHTCQKPAAVCPAVKCACNCKRSGFKRDGKGCQTCQCNDPCECHQCSSNQKCVVKRPPCILPKRLGGRCPSPVAVCVNTAVCPAVKCACNCKRSGFKRDRKGCQTCQCNDPCECHRCSSNQKCVVKRPPCSLPKQLRDRCPSPVAECVNKCKDQEPCNIRCAYGLKYDSDGCQLCECQENPCNLVDCPSDKVCIAVNRYCPPGVSCKNQFEARCVDR